MTKFIELHYDNYSKNIAINLDNIIHIFSHDGSGTMIKYVGERDYEHVSESYDEVINIIKCQEKL